MSQRPEGAVGTVDFEKLNGLIANLYYCNELNRFQLGSVIFEAIEDENDGYRSMLQEVVVVTTNAEKRPGNYLAAVKINRIEDGYFDGWEIVDELDGHVWLQLGTNNVDDYYPCFVFNFQAKKPINV